MVLIGLLAGQPTREYMAGQPTIRQSSFINKRIQRLTNGINWMVGWPANQHMNIWLASQPTREYMDGQPTIQLIPLDNVRVNKT